MEEALWRDDAGMQWSRDNFSNAQGLRIPSKTEKGTHFPCASSLLPKVEGIFHDCCHHSAIIFFHKKSKHLQPKMMKGGVLPNS